MATKFERLSSGKVKITNTTSGKIVFLRSDLTEQYDHQDDAKIQLKDGVTVYAFEWINAQNSASVSLGASRNAVQLELATNYFFNNASVLVNNALDLGIIPLNSFIVGTGADPILKTAEEVKTILNLTNYQNLQYSAINDLTLTLTGTNSMFTSVNGDYLGSQVVPTGLPAGTVIECSIHGRVTTIAAAGTGTLAVKVGSNIMTLVVPTTTLTNSMSNYVFKLDFSISIRNANICIVHGKGYTGNGTTNTLRPVGMVAQNAFVNFNSATDADRKIDATYTFGTTGNTLVIQQSSIKIIRP